MNLDFTDSELAFQKEAREWLAANVPAQALPSMDTPAGFEAHREWEAKLADARWAVVSWPEEYHGRGASLVEWVIFEEEYYRAAAPGRVSQNGIFLLSPRSLKMAPRSSKIASCPRWPLARRSGPSAGLSLRRAPISPPCAPPPSATTLAAAGCSMAKRSGAHVLPMPTWALGCSDLTPRASATTDSPISSSPSTPMASRCDRSPNSTGSLALPRSSMTTSSCLMKTF